MILDADESMVVEITPVEKTTEGQTAKSDKKKKTGLKLGKVEI